MAFLVVEPLHPCPQRVVLVPIALLMAFVSSCVPLVSVGSLLVNGLARLDSRLFHRQLRRNQEHFGRPPVFQSAYERKS